MGVGGAGPTCGKQPVSLEVPGFWHGRARTELDLDVTSNISQPFRNNLLRNE